MRSTILTILLALGTSALYAQSSAAPAGNPALTEARQAYNQIKTNWTGMAAKMPAESYDFKPAPEIRSFGELVAHVADTQTNLCSAASGQPKRGDAATKKTKDDLVAALQASVDLCDAAWEGTTDANASQLVGGGRMQRSRLGTLIQNTTHDNEEYGYGAVYLRLKGIVPPSSDRSGMGGRGGR